MMINTFKFSKGLIISIVYNVIILTFVKCDGSGTKDNKKPPVLDYEPGGVNDKNYFQYHFRNIYPGQLKLNPKIYFASKYSCLSMVLPELENTINDKYDWFDNYNECYLRSLNNKHMEYKGRLEKLKYELKAIKIMEADIDNAVQKTYKATEKAYLAVDDIKDNIDGNEIELEKNKDLAIQDYLKNQMSISTQRSTISVMYDEIEILYEIKNFELYINPTEEMFYLSKVIEEEISALEKAIPLLNSESCLSLNYEEYHEVIFLYLLLPNKKTECSSYEKMKIKFTLKLQDSFNNPKLAYKFEDFQDPNKRSTKDYKSVCNMTKSKYVVNNENYLSYFIRLKAQGYIGIHHEYHKYMYGVRTENYNPPSNDNISYTIDMDIYEENFKCDEIQPIENNPIHNEIVN